MRHENRDLWRSPWRWTALALLTGVRAIVDWPMADNHAYLLAYWCTAFAVPTWFPDRDSLARNARLLIGLTYEQIYAAREYLEGDYRHGPLDVDMPFALPVAFYLLARLSTLWNLVEQTLVAVAFLAPPASFPGRLRDPLLLVFCFTIYAVAPVPSFGWLLIAMGVAQTVPS